MNNAAAGALLAVLFAAAAGAQPNAPARLALRHEPADAARLERVLRDAGVERVRPSPSAAAYAGHVAERVAERLAAAFGDALRAVRASGLDPRWLAWAILALALVALGLGLAGLAQRRGGARPLRLGHLARPRADDAARLRDRDAWALELQRRLAAGDPAAALEALWWWLARSLSGAAVDASWTSRELLARTQRLDLSPLATALDVLIYGPEPPAVDDVRRLAARLQAALP